MGRGTAAYSAGSLAFLIEFCNNSILEAIMKKITFVTPHSWISNRQGGFHKFAEAACQAGVETVFFSFVRPYYSCFQHSEIYNAKSIRELKKGITYQVGKSLLHNVALPTLKLPNVIGKFFPDGVMNFLAGFSFSSFDSLCKKWLDGSEAFVFESSDALVLFDRLKKRYPGAKFIYRPSDPLMIEGGYSRYRALEENALRKADLNIIVNQEGLDLYRRKIADFDQTIKWQLLTNGVDIESYQKTYPVPPLLQKPNTVLYVGAWEVEWPLLFKAAQEMPDFNYIVVCPNYPSNTIQERAAAASNLFYVPGIKPAEVPAWITNARVIMVPYVTDFYKNRPLGITAKYYQAMAAKKPIVAYCDTPKLKDAGVFVTYTYDDFIGAVKEAVKLERKEYSFDLSNRRWESVTQKFLELVENC